MNQKKPQTEKQTLKKKPKKTKKNPKKQKKKHDTCLKPDVIQQERKGEKKLRKRKKERIGRKRVWKREGCST
jgi:hypothetical protein